MASVNFASTSRLTCVTDPADNVQLRSVAPGQLVSLFGNDLAPVTPFTPPGGVQASTANFGVTFNGAPAPILYSSGQQINIQVPFEIAGQSTVQMQINDNHVALPLSESHPFGVVARQPSIFLSPAAWLSAESGFSPCNNLETNGEAAVAINADGTLNSCANPAVSGSQVRLFVNGLGQQTPALTTGAIAASPAVPVSAGLTINAGSLSPGYPAAAATVPGAISGLAQLQLSVPEVSGLQGFRCFPNCRGRVSVSR